MIDNIQTALWLMHTVTPCLLAEMEADDQALLCKSIESTSVAWLLGKDPAAALHAMSVSVPVTFDVFVYKLGKKHCALR